MLPKKPVALAMKLSKEGRRTVYPASMGIHRFLV
jgi:hypothetical protein